MFVCAMSNTEKKSLLIAMLTLSALTQWAEKAPGRLLQRAAKKTGLMNVKQISSGTDVLSELSLGMRPASTRFTLKELSSALRHGARVKPVMRPARLDQVKARGPLPVRRAGIRLRRGQTEVDIYDRTQYRGKDAPYGEQRDHEQRRDLLLALRRAQ